MINLALSREIYGLTPWCVDQTTLPALLSILDNSKTGVNLDNPEQKYNSIEYLNTITNETKLVSHTWQLNSNEDFEGIGIIRLDGVITVSGGASSYGVDYLKSTMKAMARDSRIKSFIVLGDSGGGSAMAVKIMSDAIKEIDKTKPVYGLVKEGGIMASACFGIMSACRMLYAESKMSIVGSGGTMMQFAGRAANVETEDKVKHIRLYAPESTHKNHGVEEALNNDNYAVLKDELLKPFNDEFLTLLESNRPMLKGTSFRNGHTVFAKDGVGTFIDGIKSFAEVIKIATGEIVVEPKSTKSTKTEEKTKNNKSNINLNQNQMTKAEFKAANPTAYAEIVAEGVSNRSDQVGSWLAHVNTDPQAVVAGIESGKDLTQTAREGFFVKQNAKNSVKTLVEESAEEIPLGESKANETILTAEQKALNDAFDFDLK